MSMKCVFNEIIVFFRRDSFNILHMVQVGIQLINSYSKRNGILELDQKRRGQNLEYATKWFGFHLNNYHLILSEFSNEELIDQHIPAQIPSWTLLLHFSMTQLPRVYALFDTKRRKDISRKEKKVEVDYIPEKIELYAEDDDIGHLSATDRKVCLCDFLI